MKKTGWIVGMVLACLIAAAGVVMSGCGGGELNLTPNGCIDYGITKSDMFSWSRGWDCNGSEYGATCTMDHHSNGVKIACQCFEYDDVTGGVKLERGYTTTSKEWNDSMPPEDSAMFVKYVQKVPACKWWDPPL